MIKVTNGLMEEIPLTTIKFNGGELHPTIVSPIIFGDRDPMITITADLHSSDEIMELLLVKDAIDRRLAGYPGKVLFRLVMNYFPYARQDRVANPGEALGAAVMAKLINSMNFDTVYCYDLHSTVSEALINNLVHYTQEDTMGYLEPWLLNLVKGNNKSMLLAPDAGAAKKTEAIAKRFRTTFAVASKKRDTATGQLSGFKIEECDEADLVGAENIIIVDDICDGGGTFIGLAQMLREKGVTASLHLVVTNGIFSKGKECLFEHFESVNALFDWTE